MAIVVDDVVALARALRDQLGAGSHGALITVDGLPASGKSSLCDALAPQLGGAHVDLDDHVTPDQGTYVAALRLSELRAALDRALTQGGPVLLGGVCADEIAQQLGLRPAVRIYVQRVDVRGDWFDGEHLADPRRSASEIIAAEEREYSQPLTPLTREVIAYHQNHRPQDTADFIFQRTED